jgi:hypothetical protein
MKDYKITPVVARVVVFSCGMWQLAEGDKEGFNSSADKLNKLLEVTGDEIG